MSSVMSAAPARPGRRGGTTSTRSLISTSGSASRHRCGAHVERMPAHRFISPACATARAIARASPAAAARPGRRPSRPATCDQFADLARPVSTGTCDDLAVAARRTRRSCRRAGRSPSGCDRRDAACARPAALPRQERHLRAHLRQHARIDLVEATFTITVAFARSTVGTMRLMRAAKAHVRAARRAGSRTAGPTWIFARFDSDTSASTSSVAMSAIVTTAPLRIRRRRERRDRCRRRWRSSSASTPSNGARISVCSTRDLRVARVRLRDARSTRR